MTTKILYLDSTQNFSDGNIAALNKAGFIVAYVEPAEDIVLQLGQALHVQKWDGIILDPIHFSTREQFRQLLSLLKGVTAKIILTTALSEPNLRFDALLVKPFYPSDLEAKVKEVFQSKE